jgi:hypothetical protein
MFVALSWPAASLLCSSVCSWQLATSMLAALPWMQRSGELNDIEAMWGAIAEGVHQQLSSTMAATGQHAHCGNHAMWACWNGSCGCGALQTGHICNATDLSHDSKLQYDNAPAHSAALASGNSPASCTAVVAALLQCQQ